MTDPGLLPAPVRRRHLCPQCKRTRFIPTYTAPYCTPSCKRDAQRTAGVCAITPDGPRYGMSRLSTAIQAWEATMREGESWAS